MFDVPKCIKMVFFFKIIFEISTSKQSKTYKKIKFYQKQKKIEFFGNAVCTAFPNGNVVMCYFFILKLFFILN
jgi:hypothetical protein